MNARTSATITTITHQYSRIRSILSPIPLRVMMTAKLVQIGERQPEKKAYERDREALRDQRNAGVVCPLSARDPRQLAHQPDELGPLEVVCAPGKDQPTAQRSPVQVHLDLSHLVMVEDAAGVMFDAVGQPFSAAERAMPQGCENERKKDPDGEGCIASGRSPESHRSDRAADQQADRKAWPEIAPQGVHAVSRASSRQPISRRWKPSAKSIWSTARYARARALANVSATAVTARTRPPLATNVSPERAVPA